MVDRDLARQIAAETVRDGEFADLLAACETADAAFPSTRALSTTEHERLMEAVMEYIEEELV